MPPRLGEHALARIDQQDRDIRRRCAGDHVPGVLLVSGRVGDDELALVACEEAIGDIDCDALLALGGQPVDEKREIELSARLALALALGFQGSELVVEHLVAVVKQPPDEGRFSVIDAPASDEAKHLLGLVASKPFGDVACDQLAIMVEREGHQK